MDGINRYKVGGKIQQLVKNYERTCILGHEHSFSVMYDFKKNVFTISKEEFASPEDIKEEWERIYKLLEKETCNFCDNKISIGQLAGFLHDNYNSYDIEEPVCNTCWKDHWGAIDSNDHYYCSLKHYLLVVGLLGDEECKSCPAFYDYPKKGYIACKGTPDEWVVVVGRIGEEIDDADDLGLVNQFIKETDIEWERNPDEGGSAVLEVNPEELERTKKQQAKCQHIFDPAFSKGKRCVECFSKTKPNA